MSKCISISITKEYIHAVEMTVNRDRLSVKKYKSVKMKEPVLKNDMVDIEMLKNLINEATLGMKPSDVYITAPATTGVSNEYILPFDKKASHMSAMIWGNISNNLSPEKYLMDYSISSVFDVEGVKKCKVMAYLMPKSIVLDIHNAVTQSGLKPRCFDVPQNAIYKFYKAAMKNETVLLTNLSEDEIKLHLINPPNSTITRATTVSSSGIAIEHGDNPVHIVMADQVSKMLQFQSIKQPDKSIEKISLFGDLADEKAVAYLSERNDIEVSLLSIPDGKIQLNGANLAIYAYNIGAVL